MQRLDCFLSKSAVRLRVGCAIAAHGKPLFKPRRTELAPVFWEDRRRDGRLRSEAVAEYVREGHNQAIAEKRNYIGFCPTGTAYTLPEEWVDLDGREQMDTLLKTRLKALKNERAEEGDPDLKAPVFTEFAPTQEMLYEFLSGRGHGKE